MGTRIPPDSPLAHFAALLAGWAAQAKDGASVAEPWFGKAAAAEPDNVLYAYLHAQALAGGSISSFKPAISLETTENDQVFVQLHRAQLHLDPPNLRLLNDKVALHRLLAAVDPPPAKPFWPRGFILPGDRTQAEAAETQDNMDAATGTVANSKASAPRWVLKHRASMGGLGVIVHSSVADITQERPETASEKAEEESLLQTYVYPPVLVEGRKFSLRTFLVIYFDPKGGEPVGYVAHKGLALLAPKLWESDHLWPATVTCTSQTNRPLKCLPPRRI